MRRTLVGPRLVRKQPYSKSISRSEYPGEVRYKNYCCGIANIYFLGSDNGGSPREGICEHPKSNNPKFPREVGEFKVRRDMSLRILISD
jgi:hypothetical protein